MIITYIIESQGYYKIGRTDDMERRITEYNTHNPKYEVIHIISMDCESFLHKHFESKRVRFEWFDLLNEDIDWIKSNHELLSQNTQEIKDKKAKEDRDIIKAEKKKNQMVTAMQHAKSL